MAAHHRHRHSSPPPRRRQRGLACTLTRGAAGNLLLGGLLVALFVCGWLHVQQSAAHSSSSGSSSGATQQLLKHLYHGPGPASYGPLAIEQQQLPPANEVRRPNLRGGGSGNGFEEGEAAAAAVRAAGDDGTRPRRRRYLAFVPLKGLKPASSGTGQRDDDEEEEEEDGSEGSDAPTRPFRDRSTPAAVAAGGPSRATLEVERLTLKAWNALAVIAASGEDSADGRPVDLAVFGVVEDAAHCDAELLARLPYVTCLPLAAACRHPEFGIMTVDCVLRAAWAQGHSADEEEEEGEEGYEFAPAPPDVYILANGDVVFTPSLLDAIGLVYGTFVDREQPPTPPPTAPPTEQGDEDDNVDGTGAAAAPPTPAPPLFIPPGTTGFALVGRRLDLNVSLPTRPEDPPLTEASLLDPGITARLHQALGVDYFAFTPDAFPQNFPPFLVGRWRWDNALLLHFLLRRGVATVDGSGVVHALHLGMPDDSGSKQHQARAGGRYNDELASNTFGRAHALGRIDATAYVLRAAAAAANASDESSQSVAATAVGQQQPPMLQLERRARTMAAAQLAALRLAGGRGAGLMNAGVTVLPVPYGQADAALEWVCWARARAGVGTNVVLLAADKDEAAALAAAMGGLGPDPGDGDAVVHLQPRALSIKGGAGGNMRYYRDKRTGRASAEAMELGTAHVVQRLLRLNLTVTVADMSLRWNRDPAPLLLGAGGEGDGACGLVMLDAEVPTTTAVETTLGSSSIDISSNHSPLYLLRPSLDTAREWRRVLACIGDKIRHPKRYAPGYCCVRTRLVDGVVGLEENGAEDDEGASKGEEGVGGKDDDAATQRPWRACLIDPGAPGSWFPARASLRQRGDRLPSVSLAAEPWGVLDDGQEGEEEDDGTGSLWDAEAGQCVGVFEGWLASALQAPPPLNAQESRE